MSRTAAEQFVSAWDPVLRPNTILGDDCADKLVFAQLCALYPKVVPDVCILADVADEIRAAMLGG